MLCEKCGVENPETALYCKSCGKPFDAVYNDFTMKMKSTLIKVNSGIKISILFFMITISLLIISLFVYSYFQDGVTVANKQHYSLARIYEEQFPKESYYGTPGYEVTWGIVRTVISKKDFSAGICILLTVVNACLII